MATGYGGTYRASVVDDADPAMQHRLLVVVPDVYGSDPAWARPSMTSGAEAVPTVGSEVLVSFEGGDTDYPVWQAAGAGFAGGPGVAHGCVGVYRAHVLDNVDPSQDGRLLVSVPDVIGSDSVWAARSPSLGSEAEVPDVGAEVWVEFEGAAPDHPIWTGLA
jgi:hypothetical protein